MIKDPIAIVAILLSIEIIILFLATHAKTKAWFKYVPSIFWIYFLPMLASSIGIIDPKSPLYSFISNTFLPMSLFVLLMTVDICAIFRLGKKALIMFFAGGVGVGIGVSVAFVVFKPWIGSQYWSGFGALAGSWTGGSANMIAVKEALGTPDDVFFPMVIVDTIVPYLWMAFMVIVAHHQHHYDRFNQSDRGILDEINQRMNHQKTESKGIHFMSTLGIVGLAVAGGLFAKFLSQFFPVAQGIISSFAWTIIIVSILGICCSLTSLKKVECYGSGKIGNFILYFVLTTIGAKASISNIGNAAILIAAGFLIVFIHAIVLLIVGRIIRAPLFLAAVASQANVGGVASAPMVAEIYQKGFGSVGLLLAILGNIVGTYFGIAVGQICRLFS